MSRVVHIVGEKEGQTVALNRDTEGLILSRGGTTIEVIEYGARLRRCLVPDAAGHLADVVPGMASEVDYRERGGTMGAVLGRYGNRIGFGRVEIGGRIYELSRNDGPHTMHGGAGHFGTRKWHGRREGESALCFELTSEDGDQGWPGNVEAQVIYELDPSGGLSIEMTAVADQPTYLNMIFHGYWNLAGHRSGTIQDHLLRVAAETYLPKNDVGLPSGIEAPVEGTPFDFRHGIPIGRNIGATGRGFAHNLCVANHSRGWMRPVARLADPKSGRALELSADQPGVQLFTANSWSSLSGKDDAIYGAHSAVALETQAYPNTPNTPAFGPRLVDAGERYRHQMRVRFSALARSEVTGYLEAPWAQEPD